MGKRAREASSSSQKWPPKILPEHTIFLSHSGHDKPFVERLCETLERWNYSPFFDQNSDSLPKGERFTSYLFQAAERCLLAVIVLSEGYLTSKWPMLELGTFVKAQKTTNPDMKLLPLFYKLSPSDLVPEKWMESWKKLATDGKINAKEIDLWSEGVEVLMKAKNVETERMKVLIEYDEQDKITPDDFSKFLAEVVKDLRPFNGLEFSKYGSSEGRYIQAVVLEICKIIPPLMKYNTDGIRGYQRMCEKASSLFEEGVLANDVCRPGCLYLGLYGMGGVGKTTLCEAMCSFYEVKFRGRVCHVELQSDTSDERIKRLKHVIRQLGGVDDRVVERITRESEGLKMLKDRLGSRAPAFLVVDNVGDSESSRDEARRFIRCVLACGSKVMVTSRSRSILESVLRESKYCKPIPRLEKQEAQELFLSVAIPQKMSSPLQFGEEKTVKACVRGCKYFDDGYDTQQYHPLVLRALGTFFHDVDTDDIMEWEEALKSDKKLQASRESQHVNDILGLNYATLSAGQKLLFLDVVFLFNSEESTFLQMTSLSYRGDDSKWAIPLLAAMHGISTFDAKMKVKELQRKSLIYESDPSLKTHDLYIEFAQSMVAMEGSKEKEWWVGHRDANGYNPMVKRLFLVDNAFQIGLPVKELWECPNLECLIMDRCKVALAPKLDLECVPNLRVLILCSYKWDDFAHYEREIFFGRKDQKQGCLRELRMVKLSWFDLRRASFLRHCSNLTFLGINDCDFDLSDFTRDVVSLLENLKALETLILSPRPFYRVSSCFIDGILQGAKELKNLKYLEIDLRHTKVYGGGVSKLDLGPLGPLTSLRALSLPRLPHCIEELVGLDQLSQLVELNLQGSDGLRKLPNLDLLPNLRRICVCDCDKLVHLADQFKRFQEFHSVDMSHPCLEPDFTIHPVDRFLQTIGFNYP